MPVLELVAPNICMYFIPEPLTLDSSEHELRASYFSIANIANFCHVAPEATAAV